MTVSAYAPRGYGVNSGRIQPTRIAPIEGNWTLCLGSDQTGVSTLLTWDDTAEAYEQEIEKNGAINLTMRAVVFGPPRMPVFSDPSPWVLSDGGTLILRADREDVTITWDADDFVDISLATADEVVNVLSATLSDEWAVNVEYGDRLRIESTQTGRQSEITVVGGTTSGAFGFRFPRYYFFVEIDGTRTYQRAVRPGDAYLVRDILSALEDVTDSAPYRLGLELGEEFGNPGSWTTFMELPLPAVYVDDLIYGVSARTSAGVIANRIPEPPETHRVDAPIELDIINDGSPLAGLEIYLAIDGGIKQLAWSGGAAQPPFDGPLAGSFAIWGNQTRFILDPADDLPGEALIEVFIDGTPGGGYSFMTEDVTGPVISSILALGKTSVQVAWDEGVDDTALDASVYTITPVDVPAVTPEVLSVSRLTTSVVVLQLDEPLSIGKTYLLSVTSVDDIYGNDSGPVSGTFLSYIPPRTPGNRSFQLIKTLPEWNRIEQDQLGDLARFVACLQEVTDILLCEIDGFVTRIDPDQAPGSVLDLMLYDLANPFGFTLTDGQKLLLVRSLVDIYKSKGTKPGIIAAIQFFLGITVDLVEINSVSVWKIGLSFLGEDTILGTDDQKLLYSFDVIAPRVLTDDELARMIEIIDVMKPAHTHLRNVEQPEEVGIIDHVELGLSELGLTWILH